MIRCVLLLAVCSLLAACSSSTTSFGDAGNPGSDAGTDAGAPLSDGGTDAGSDAGVDGGSDAGIMGGGAVSFSAGTPGVQGDLFQIVAVFAEGNTSVTGGPVCSAAVGACQYCPSPNPDAGLPVVHVQVVGAGVLTFNDGNNNLATLGDDAGDGIYSTNSSNDPALTWNPGDALSVSASGGTIPAFSSSLVAPHPISGLSPALSLVAPISLSLSQPFVISWAPSGDSGATMLLVLGDDSAGRGTVSCTVPESAGTISVAASLLASYSSGDDGTAQLTRTVTDNTDAGTFPILVNANAPTVAGSVSYAP